MRRREQGFSLFEMMIALTIVSILAVIAVPMYLNYDVRAKVSEGLYLAGPAKDKITEFFQITSTWPASNADAGLPDPTGFKTAYVDTISLSNTSSGTAVTITYSIPALGSNNTLILTASQNGSNMVVWECSKGSIIEKYRPPACKS